MRTNPYGFAAYLGLRGRPYSRNNPRTSGLRRMFEDDVYDPREEAVRAVARGSGMWGVAVGGYGKSHTPQQIVKRSWERYQDVDHLIRARQVYEIMLSSSRQSDPLRVTSEPTSSGIRHFVWPLAVGSRVPHAHRTRQDAENEMALRYRDRTPIAQSLPRETYARGELAAWLPPDSVFDERTERPSKPALREAHKKSEGPVVTDTSSLLAQYRAFSPLWHSDPVLMAAFIRKEAPPKR